MNVLMGGREMEMLLAGIISLIIDIDLNIILMPLL